MSSGAGLLPIEMSRPWRRALERKGLPFSLLNPLQTHLIHLHTPPSHGREQSHCPEGTAQPHSSPWLGHSGETLPKGSPGARGQSAGWGAKPGDPPTLGCLCVGLTSPCLWRTASTKSLHNEQRSQMLNGDQIPP